MTGFPYRDGELYAEGVPLRELAARHGTPLYVYSLNALRERFLALRAAFAGLDPLIAYSVKANPNLAVVRALAREGSGADVVSVGELERALRAGVPADKIVFSGVGKRPDELRRGVEAGILCFNVEVADELEILSSLASELGREVSVSFRVNPDVDAGTHEYITVGRKVNKFGLPTEEVPALYARAVGLPGVVPRGIDCHIGSQLASPTPFGEALARLATLVQALRADGHTVDLVDVGGGLGVRYTDEEPPSLEAYSAVVREHMEPLGVRLILEPGRAIVANAGVLLTQVLYRKENRGKRFVIADAAMNDLPRPALYQAKHSVLPVREDCGQVTADLVGPVCETGDFLARNGEVPDATPGDLLAILSAGAYCRSMASDYNTRPRAAEILVDGTQDHVIQPRETIDQILARESIPESLR